MDNITRKDNVNKNCIKRKYHDNGNIRFELHYLNDKHHREDGPAIEDANGNKAWYLNGKLHREDGPAIEDADGDKEWYLNDKIHREDGPALERANGFKSWWLDGKRYSETEYKRELICRGINKEPSLSDIMDAI